MRESWLLYPTAGRRSPPGCSSPDRPVQEVGDGRVEAQRWEHPLIYQQEGGVVGLQVLRRDDEGGEPDGPDEVGHDGADGHRIDPGAGNPPERILHDEQCHEDDEEYGGDRIGWRQEHPRQHPLQECHRHVVGPPPDEQCVHGLRCTGGQDTGKEYREGGEAAGEEEHEDLRSQDAERHHRHGGDGGSHVVEGS